MTTIRAVPLFVGLTASWGTSFQILEMAADRRCSGLRRDFKDDFITSAAYKIKLDKLIRDEARSAEGERSESTYARGILISYIVNPISDSIQYLSRDNLVLDKSKEVSNYACTQIPKMLAYVTSTTKEKSDD